MAARVYKRSFYLGEIISQLCVETPPVPPELLRLIVDAYLAAPPPLLTQRYIQRLCRSITARPSAPSDILLPPELQQRYKTARTGKPLTSLSKYSERWRTIIAHLTGVFPPALEGGLINFILDHFIESFEGHFERTRHTPSCASSRHRTLSTCHKTHGCRHNIPSLNYVIKKFMLQYYGSRTAPQYLALKPWVPQTGRRTRRRTFDRYWLPYARDNHLALWPLVPKLQKSVPTAN